MINDYLEGLVAMAGVGIWIVGFNLVWAKIAKEPLWEVNLLAPILMPFIAPTAVVAILCIPLAVRMAFP